MRKAIAVVLATAIAVSVAMIGCSKNGKKEDSTSTTIDGLIGNEDTYEIVDEEVTDEKGETVTDKNGNAVTTQVMYKETTDKKATKSLLRLMITAKLLLTKTKSRSQQNQQLRLQQFHQTNQMSRQVRLQLFRQMRILYQKSMTKQSLLNLTIPKKK